MTTIEFNQRLRDLLIVPELQAHLKDDLLYNGAQTWGNVDSDVQRVGLAVSVNRATIEAAIETHCDALIVHHGLFLPAKQLDRLTYERLALLIKYDIMLWSAHFVLDAHPILGNNAQILQAIDVREHEPWIDWTGAPWGRSGCFEEPRLLTDIVAQLQPVLSPRTLLYDGGPSEVTYVVSVSGAGAPNDFHELREQGVDLYITGEVSERHLHQALEAGINLLAGGHYHTERFGVRALQPILEEWGVEVAWIEFENEV